MLEYRNSNSILKTKSVNVEEVTVSVPSVSFSDSVTTTETRSSILKNSNKLSTLSGKLTKGFINHFFL
jgi:hypothetical protein